MQVIKRDGSSEPLKFDKISMRVKKQTYGLNSDFVDHMEVSKKVIAGVYDGISSRQLDELAAETAASMTDRHPDYSILGARIALTALHKDTDKDFFTTAKKLHEYVHQRTGEPAGLISDEVMEFIEKNRKKLSEAIVHDRDFNFDYFGFKTLEKSYLLKRDGRIAETPQHMYMRIACGMWCNDIQMAIKTYEMLSTGQLSHATPTMFNSGTKRPQLSSCFLLDMDDSIEGIYHAASNVAKLSKNAGGIGISVSKIRAKGSYIKGTNGTSNGIVPMLRVFNETARYVDQGGGKRKGAVAVYIEPWHADIVDFLDLRKNQGKEEMRTRDLFTALWISDIFMERVDANEKWPLFSPDEVPMLTETYGDEFREWFLKYEAEGKALRVVDARDLWNRVLASQIETGTPYMLYKDAINKKSNQKNIGIIRSSNLCTEITLHTNPGEVAVCNLASIPVNRFVVIPGGKNAKDKTKRTFDFEQLYEAAYQAAVNLNRVIDINFYPIPEAELSNKKNRPIGIGVQGLADAFVMLGLAFDSYEAKILNSDIYETIYFAALNASCDLAKKQGTYETYEGSPASEGKLQYDMWGITEADLSERWDWKGLKARIAKHGLRNSMLTTQMPTASTAQILGNNESMEPFASNLYKRTTLSGEFIVVNKHLVEDLDNLGLWSDEMRIKLIAAKGSIQSVQGIPDEIKERYKTIWEISQRTLLDMSADRGRFTCQTQSMNLFIRDVNVAKLTSAHFYGWRLGLKTGMYYLRTNQAVDAQAGLAVDQAKLQEVKAPEVKQQEEDTSAFCSLDNPDACDSCSA